MQSTWPQLIDHLQQLQFDWATPQNPIYRRESERLKKWLIFNKYLSPTDWLTWVVDMLFEINTRLGSWAIIIISLMLLIGLPVVGLIVVDLFAGNTVASALLMLGLLTLPMLILLIPTLAVWMIGLAATIGGAFTIAPERQASTWETLRLTPLRPIDLIGGKVAAVVVTLFKRFLGLIVAALLLRTLFFMVFSNLFAIMPNAYLAWLFGGLVILIEPALQIFYAAGLGVLASSLTRDIASALALTFSLHLFGWILRFNLALFVARLLATPSLFANLNLFFATPTGIIAAFLTKLALAILAYKIAFKRAEMLTN